VESKNKQGREHVYEMFGLAQNTEVGVGQERTYRSRYRLGATGFHHEEKTSIDQAWN
jgi:hypothetical protein